MRHSKLKEMRKLAELALKDEVVMKMIKSNPNTFSDVIDLISVLPKPKN